MALGMKVRDECGVQKPVANLETMGDSPTCEDCRILFCIAHAASQRDAGCRQPMQLEVGAGSTHSRAVCSIFHPVNIQLG